jgi:hypothetical protein
VIALYVLLALVLLVNCFIGWRLNGRNRSSSLVKKTVIVNTVDGQSLKGVLLYQHLDRYTLTNSAYLQANGSDTPIDGLAHIPLRQISFIQEVNE